MEYRLQSIYSHMVLWAASVVSPFYPYSLGITHFTDFFKNWKPNLAGLSALKDNPEAPNNPIISVR